MFTKNKLQPCKNPLNFALYISLFPQLIAGPIVRYSTIANQIQNRTVNLQNFSSGIETFIIGLAKKVIIANTFGQIHNEIMLNSPENLTPILIIIAMISYTIQIYFDFSGYSNMAIGLSRIFVF